MKNILFPIALSTHAVEVFHAALTLADSFQARILLIHSFETPAYPIQGHEVDAFTQNVMAKLMLFKETNIPKKYAHVTISYLAEMGVLADAILEAVEDKKIDLIILGSPEMNNSMGVFYGEIFHVVAHNTACPILIIPPFVIV